MKKTKTKKLAKKIVRSKIIKRKKVQKKRAKKTARKPAPKTKDKKTVVSGKKTENLLRLADALTEKGKKRGFITYDEILKTFPDIENNILFLDELYEKFSVAGVDVL